MQRVLILGGYGAFGGLAAERLARVPGIEVIVAGRSAARAQSFAARLASQARARVCGVGLDARDVGGSTLGDLRPAVLINATGPYQTQDYRVARAAIDAGMHYLDLADARPFVTGIAALNEDAHRAGVLVVSGASSVPAVSGAVLDAYASRIGCVETVETVIAPANSFDPGIGTTRSILGNLGKPLDAWHLIAASGHGPYIPATPSVLLAKRLLSGTLTIRGAMPCVGLFTLDEFLAELADLDIVAGAA